MTPLECGIIIDGIPEGAISRKVGLIWGIPDWYYSTLKELHQANGKDDSALKWTLIMFIPIIGLLSAWHHSSEYAEFVDGKYPGIAIFILWLVFVPVVWILVQSDLNRAASPSS